MQDVYRLGYLVFVARPGSAAQAARAGPLASVTASAVGSVDITTVQDLRCIVGHRAHRSLSTENGLSYLAATESSAADLLVLPQPIDFHADLW